MNPCFKMKAIEKVLWYIENHYRESIDLDAISRVAGLSRSHLSRLFCYSIGMPFSQYLRKRRLGYAAQELAAGERDILDLALSIGYGSHEAFSRAFKQEFGQTPERTRQIGHTRNLDLLETISMNTGISRQLDRPTKQFYKAVKIVGLSRTYLFADLANIPDQWQSFVPFVRRLTSAEKQVTYGVIHATGEDSIDYLCGLEPMPGVTIPDALVSIELPAREYLVFEHSDHISSVGDTVEAIWSDYFPDSDDAPLDAPWFERYGESFDAQTGEGGLQIWIPIAD